MNQIDPGTREESFPINATDKFNSLVCRCMMAVWSVLAPWPFQIFAIFCLVYLTGQFMLLIRKTGEGKSLVPATVAAILRGITVIMVLLIGLGSDQVNKYTNLGKGVESIHVDETKGEDFTNLCLRLLAMKKGEYGRTPNSMILFCSPKQLQPKTKFSIMLEISSKRGIITSTFIDEAHTISQYGAEGSNFCPEFDGAYKNLIRLAAASSNGPLNICLMSGTLPKDEQTKLITVGGQKPTVVLHGLMGRRRIFIGVDAVGQPASGIRRCIMTDYKSNPTRKVIINSHSKRAAERTFTSLAESTLETLQISANVMALTGDCGIMMKVFLMACFSGAKFDDEDATVDLLNILIMPCTDAANCGISSNDCYRAYRYGLPQNLIQFAQEMGRVDRDHTIQVEVREHRYNLFLSFGIVMNIFLRIFKHESKSVRDSQVSDESMPLYLSVHI